MNLQRKQEHQSKQYIGLEMHTASTTFMVVGRRFPQSFGPSLYPRGLYFLSTPLFFSAFSSVSMAR